MLKDKKILPPPWLAYPEIERYSIGWRMGYGESYIMKWSTWLNTLSPDETAEYQKLFPEPVTWSGYWNHNDDCRYYENGDFFMELWRENGTPKYSLEQIRKEHTAGKTSEFLLFWGHQPSPDGDLTKSCFSQWWKTDFYSVTKHYCCMEQFMMAKKAELFGDEEILKQILSSEDPKQIKALGRKVKNFDEAIWNEIKYSIVLNGNFLKFSQNSELKAFLLSTGDKILAEASPYDGVWGIKMSVNNENVRNPLKWRGQNLLGFALMEVRDELRKICEHESHCEKIEPE